MTKPSKETAESKADTAKAKDPVELVDHVSVDCEALLGSGQMTIGQLSKLTKGDLVALNRSPADPVDIRVNGKTIARGEIVTVDDRFAIRLTEIG
ncbi:MAG: FliM/FliN family flagellar motor switch protein [Erythrobacter sp.]|uniref:FliM/FliN family flagellar motor switch protein n=1 Tax=Erythrobacter sp. TaxID=1042 RepID=UPI0032669DC5